MRKIAIFCTLMCSLTLSAQGIDLRQKTKGFELEIKPIIVSESVGQFKPLSFELDLMGGYRFNQYVRIGIGFGGNMTTVNMSEEEIVAVANPNMSEWDVKVGLVEPLSSGVFIGMPLFVNVKANMTKTIVSPYVSVDCGYNFTLPFNDNTYHSGDKYTTLMKNGFMVRPSVGVDFRFKMCTMFIGVGYNYQMCAFADDVLTYKHYSQISQTIGFQF